MKNITKNHFGISADFLFNADAAIAQCEEYSERPETLRGMIESERLKVHASIVGVIPSPWNDGDLRLKALQYTITLNGYTFPFYGSHNDATIYARGWRDIHTNRISAQKNYAITKREKLKLRDGWLYSVLACIGSDLYCAECDPEDIGLDSDSIKDMAKWNEIKEHSHKLRQALRLSSHEMGALPQ